MSLPVDGRLADSAQKVAVFCLQESTESLTLLFQMSSMQVSILWALMPETVP